MYSDALMGRFLAPTYAGDLDQPEGMAQAGNETCGDVVHLALKVGDGIIVDARFRAQGCATAIASADAVCELVIGTSVTAAQMLDAGKLSLSSWRYSGGPHELRHHRAGGAPQRTGTGEGEAAPRLNRLIELSQVEAEAVIAHRLHR